MKSPAPRPEWAGSLAERGERCLIPVYRRAPVEIAGGQGCRVFDSRGREYLDFTAGIAVNTLGHRHPAMLAALERAARDPLHVSNLYWTEPMVRLAERLAAASGMERVFYCNSGAEAIEASLKVARRARPGGRVLSFQGSFHGRTMGALSATGHAPYQQPFQPLLPAVEQLPFGDFEAAARAVEGAAAVLVEPIQGEGGVRPSPPGWLAHLRRLCTESGALLLLDEVQTGIGRTGKLFAYQQEDLSPDAVAAAKGLAGGLPIGVLLTRGRAARALEPGDHGSTFGGGPFVTRVAAAVLDEVLKPAFLDTVRERGRQLGGGLERLVGRHTPVIEARGLGLMWGLVLGEPRAVELVEALRERGVLAVNAGPSVLRLLPPLVVSSTEIDAALTAIDDALAALPTTPPTTHAAGSQTGSAVEA